MTIEKLTHSSTLTVSRLDQARLLADPIKLRIIQAMAVEPHTTKQVAETLGEKPTKLYRHVDALRDAELIKLVEEKPKRGTVEKYYLAVARRFEIHPKLFAPADDSNNEIWEDFIDDAHKDIRKALQQMQTKPSKDEQLFPCISRFAVRASEDDIKRLRKQLLIWLESCEKSNHVKTEHEALQWSGLIAFYPDHT